MCLSPVATRGKPVATRLLRFMRENDYCGTICQASVCIRQSIVSANSGSQSGLSNREVNDSIIARLLILHDIGVCKPIQNRCLCTLAGALASAANAATRQLHTSPKLPAGSSHRSIKSDTDGFMSAHALPLTVHRTLQQARFYVHENKYVHVWAYTCAASRGLVISTCTYGHRLSIRQKCSHCKWPSYALFVHH